MLHRRCFFAALPDPAAVAQLLVWQNALCDALELAASRRVQAADLHLTLAFLGDLEQREACALARVRPHAELVAPLPEFELHALQRWGGRQTIWVAEFVRAQAWDCLRASLSKQLAQHGIEDDAQDFRPHVTLWRGSARVHVDDLPEFKCQTARLRFDRLVLMSRNAEPGVQRYRIVSPVC